MSYREVSVIGVREILRLWLDGRSLRDVHPRADERFEITAGRVQMKRSGETSILGVGETVIVPPGTDHVWGNPFDEPAAIAVDLYPALRMETFFETYFSLASDGKFNTKTQFPSFLQLALLMHAYLTEIGLPGLAGTATRGLAAAIAPIARARNRSRYPQYSDADAP